ncbi:MAG: hypothetical protein ACPLX8_02270 [Nanopusillaceae archaeon]
MLTPQSVLNYIKTKLGLPFVPLELLDNQILSWVRQETIPTFSWYYPHVAYLTFNTSDPNYKTEKQNEFYISDPNGSPILDIKELYYNEGNMIIMNHPILGTMSSNPREVANFLTQTENFGNSWKYSQFRYWFNFVKPNRIRIMPSMLLGTFTVEYEVFHYPDFSTINVEFQQLFLSLAWADTVLLLARIRKQFPEIQTPFGPVSLNADELKSEAQQVRDNIIETLSSANPSIIVSIG